MHLHLAVRLDLLKRAQSHAHHLKSSAADTGSAEYTPETDIRLPDPPHSPHTYHPALYPPHRPRSRGAPKIHLS